MPPLVTLTCSEQESQSETKEASWVQCISFPSSATSQNQRRTLLGRFARPSMRRFGADASFEDREVAALQLTNEATRLFSARRSDGDGRPPR